MMNSEKDEAPRDFATPLRLNRGAVAEAGWCMFLLVGSLLAGCGASAPNAGTPATRMDAPAPNAESAPAEPEAPSKPVPPSALVAAGGEVYLAEGCFTCHGAPAPWLVLPRQAPASGAKGMVELTAHRRELRWLHDHLVDPRAHEPRSIMPAYAFLAESRVNRTDDAPYANAARTLATDLAASGIAVPWDSQLVALLGFLNAIQAE